MQYPVNGYTQEFAAGEGVLVWLTGPGAGFIDAIAKVVKSS
ncbi:hypothetical protein PN499_11030 [Kamptonema animale CS-326]|nr:hypothetical protein [Kamptonema animale]MDB9511718.1 hypothetical protein [Kamptonema animale CS-326]